MIKKHVLLISISLVLFLTNSFTPLAIPPKANQIPIEQYSFPNHYDYCDSLNVNYNMVREQVDIINANRVAHGFNGKVLIGYKGQILYNKSFGYADKEFLVYNNNDTPTQIASISKTFTGMAVLWLVDRNYIDIKQPVQAYLPTFPYADITVEMLLSHRSGLPEYMQFSEHYWVDKTCPMNNNDVLNMLSSNNIKLSFTPNSRFRYCNTNFALLALIVEQISGVSFKVFIEDYFFKPLHMNNSFVFDPNQVANIPFAKGYNANFSIYQNTFQDGVYGDKGIYTTTEDLYKWDQALYSNEFIKKQTLDDAYRPRSVESRSPKNYGLGWRIYTYPNQQKLIYHTGWWHGYQGIFSRHLEDNFTIIILSNRYIKGITVSSNKIYDLSASLLNLMRIDDKNQSLPTFNDSNKVVNENATAEEE